VLPWHKSGAAAQSDGKEGARLCRNVNYTRGYKRSGNNEKSRFYNGRSIHIGGRCKEEVTKIQTGPEWSAEAQRRVMVACRGLNDRLAWVANAVGLTFVDPNSWVEEDDFVGDGVHLNGSRKRHLGNLYARVSELVG
jgi:hypothetical protein